MTIHGGRWLITVFLLLTMINGQKAFAQFDNHSEVLVLHSYNSNYEWTKTEQAGIESVFKPSDNKYSLRIEYMDSNNSPSLLEGTLLRKLYKEKFSNSHFRAIITTDNAAFDFMLLYRDELFPGVPIVFCGVNGYEDYMIADHTNVTGVAEDNDFLGLFKIIEQTQPTLQRIVIYGIPTDPSHIANVALIKKLLPTFQRNFPIEIREVPHIEACIDDAKKLPKNSVILLTGNMCTANGEGINLQRANEIVSQAVDNPLYTAWDFALNHGSVGGRVMSGLNQGRLAAEMTLRILNGKSPQTLPVERYVGNVYMFDYKQLTRFNIKKTQLPTGSTIINAPENSYHINREFMWLITVFLLLLFVAVLSLMANVRKRKKAELALSASEEKFSKAFKYCADIIGIATLYDGRYIEVSETFFEVFGYSREEVIGRISAAKEHCTAADDTFPLWRDNTARENLFQKLNTQGFFKDLEVHWCTKSGNVRIGLYSAEVVEIANESCIVYAWHDITARKQAEDALQEAHADLEDKIEYRTQELTSLNQELIAMNEELQSTNWELENEISERHRIQEELSNTNQKLSNAIDELTTMQAYLVQSEKMAALGNLVAGVAHEINTPVGVGLTAASHLQELTRDFNNLCTHGAPRRQDLTNYLQDLHESSTIILKNLERAAKLIQSFKQVSADQASEARRSFNVGQYIEEILLSIHPQLKKTKHHITFDCDENIVIDGFPGAFSQVITNLIMNSLLHGYSPNDEGNIHITAKKTPKQIILTYSDDGHGMPEDIRTKIFDPFYTTKRGAGGTGLGLYIVYNIITQQFGGKITCTSELGKGTTFRIALPISKEDTNHGKT